MSNLRSAPRLGGALLVPVLAGTPPLVSLQPGQSASAIVEALAANPDGTSCAPWAGLLVTAPNDNRSTRVPWDSDGCAEPQVHPVVPGTEGSLR